MKWIPFILLLAAGTVLGAGNLLHLIAFHEGQVRPSLLLIFLVYFAVNPRTDAAVICSFAIGFAADLAGSTMGPYTICYGLAGSLLSQTGEVMTIRHPIHQAGVVFVTGLVTGLTASWLAALKTGHASGLSVSVLMGIALYSALAAPLLWPLLRIVGGPLYENPAARRRSISSLHV